MAQEVHERTGEMRKAIADEGGCRRDGDNDRSDEAEGESARRPLFQGHSCHQLIMRRRGAICQRGSADRSPLVDTLRTLRERIPFEDVPR